MEGYLEALHSVVGGLHGSMVAWELFPKILAGSVKTNGGAPALVWKGQGGSRSAARAGAGRDLGKGGQGGTPAALCVWKFDR